MLYRFSILLWSAVLFILLSACSEYTEIAPEDIAWDKDLCVRCNMVVRDRNSSAQIRYQPAKHDRIQVAVFDDFGCAVLWMEDKPWKDDPQTEIWITDHRTGEWINARQATYIPGKLTPMSYGLGAQLDWQEGGLSFAQAKLHVIQQEQRLNAHGTHLLDKYRQQAKRREENRPLQQDDSSLPPIIPE